MMNFLPREREKFFALSLNARFNGAGINPRTERESREHAYLKKSKATRERKKKGEVRSLVIRGRKEKLYNSYALLANKISKNLVYNSQYRPPFITANYTVCFSLTGSSLSIYPYDTYSTRQTSVKLSNRISQAVRECVYKTTVHNK